MHPVLSLFSKRTNHSGVIRIVGGKKPHTTYLYQVDFWQFSEGLIIRKKKEREKRQSYFPSKEENYPGIESKETTYM